jgi:1L-myo-inositol 1-phosphate cytidylyltransferase
MSLPVHDAIVLAAGNGDRFRGGSAHSKLATPVAGIPLLVRTLTAAAEAGITHAHVVIGYDADHVRALAESGAPAGLRLHFHVNADWHRENGASVLVARPGLAGRPFGLLMGDHIFEPRVLRAMIRTHRRQGEALVGVDRYTTHPQVVAEATKLRMHAGRVTAIGKAIDTFDGLDTGLFVCDASLFDAVEAACAAGDTTLSAGIAQLAAEGLVRGVEIGRSRWCDVDTVADLALAESLVEPVSAR